MSGIVIMANLWNKTVDITATLAKQLIENQCSLRVDHIQQLDEGWGQHRLFGQSCIYF